MIKIYGIYLVRFGFRMWETLNFKWFLSLKIQINSKNQVLEGKISWRRGCSWANGTGHTSLNEIEEKTQQAHLKEQQCQSVHTKERDKTECNLNPMGVVHKVSNHESPRQQITVASFISNSSSAKSTQKTLFSNTTKDANPYICFLGISAI
jgi:hypothetical protein